jgi:hypothetical protein
MNINNFIKENLNDLINEYSEDAIKLFPKKNNNDLKIMVKNQTDININNDDDEECYSENGDEFYSKEDIYGCISDDDDSVECEEYKKLHTYMKNEKNIIPEINDDYEEEEENFKYQVEEEYENLQKQNEKSSVEDDDTENKLEKLLGVKKDNIDPIDKNDVDNRHIKQNKIKIVKFNENLNKFIKNIKIPTEKKSNNNNEEDEDENTYEKEISEKKDKEPYIINIINLFMKYFNNKYKQNLNFFAGIKNEDSDTNKQMESFIAAVDEYGYIKEKIFLNERSEFYFEEQEDVNNYLENENIENFYILQIENDNQKNIYSPSLLDCLNYVHFNNMTENNWNIYNLK